MTSFMRVTPEAYDQLFGLVGQRIVKNDTNWRSAITGKERLAITIW